MADDVVKALTELPHAPRGLGPMVLRLFMLWNLTEDEQAALLGLLPRIRVAQPQSGMAAADSTKYEIVTRIGHLLSIHQHLRALFPQNRSLAYRWMTSGNDAFNGQTPVAVVRDQGVSGLLMLRAYLGCMRGI